MNNKILKIGTLFSGIGAPEQAIHRLKQKKIIKDYELSFACEIDEYARKTFSEAYKEKMKESNTIFYKDIYEMDATKYKNNIDILIGGSPCQSFSMAGRRLGLNDKRGNLIFEYLRILEETQPKYFIYENVSGFLSIDKGSTIRNFLLALSEIGYEVTIDLLNTKTFNIPQNRERIFIIGKKFDISNKKQTIHSEENTIITINKNISNKRCKIIIEDLLLKDSNNKINYFDIFKYPNIYNTIKENKKTIFLKDILEENVDEKYFIKNKHTLTFLEEYKNKYLNIYDITKEELEKRNPYELNIQFLGGIDKTRKGMENTPNLSRAYSQKNRIYSVLGCSPTICANETQGRYNVLLNETKIQQLNTPSFSQQRIYGINGISPTISAGNNGGGKEPCKHLTYNWRVRKLTPLECLRLQDFPDSIFEVMKKVGLKDTRMYHQAGNSMTVKVLEKLFENICLDFFKK
jgi:DNA (cytosine-5)-methyltransferase 1